MFSWELVFRSLSKTTKDILPIRHLGKMSKTADNMKRQELYRHVSSFLVNNLCISIDVSEQYI